MSTLKQISDAMVTVISGISGAPSLVEWRKTDVLRPDAGDPATAVIIVGGNENATWRVFNSCVGFEYSFQVTFYGASTPVVTADDTRPTFFQLMKKALSVTTLTGTPVWDFELVTRMEWESVPFGDGVEVSRLGVLYRTSEAMN